MRDSIEKSPSSDPWQMHYKKACATIALHTACHVLMPYCIIIEDPPKKVVTTKVGNEKKLKLVPFGVQLLYLPAPVR